MSDIATIERKCLIEEVFEASFIELLKLVPANPFVRAWVLKFSGKLPPSDCETFEQLKVWVEFNCIKRVRHTSQNRSRQDDGVGITVHFSETEYGRANYSVDRSGEDTFQIGAEELLTMVQEAIDGGGGMTEVLDEITTRIDDDAWSECEPNLDNYGDYEYDEHDSTDSGNGEINYSRDQIRERVLAFMQAHYPGLAQQL